MSELSFGRAPRQQCVPPAPPFLGAHRRPDRPVLSRRAKGRAALCANSAKGRRTIRDGRVRNHRQHASAGCARRIGGAIGFPSRTLRGAREGAFLGQRCVFGSTKHPSASTTAIDGRLNTTLPLQIGLNTTLPLHFIGPIMVQLAQAFPEWRRGRRPSCVRARS
eukprot:SAG31_NODE_16_length_36206_cov_27.355728_41_plen_164_part_00